MNKQKKWTVVLLSTLFLFGCASNQTSEADVADTATQQSSLSSLADISSEQAEETEEETMLLNLLKKKELKHISVKV